MMKDDKEAMMKDKMKAEKKGQAGMTDDKMKMNEKKAIASALALPVSVSGRAARRATESKHRLASYSGR
jgi:hypothetical protein